MIARRHAALVVALVVALVLATASAPLAAQGTPAADSSVSAIPIGQGRLNQDIITLRLGTGALDIRLVPLDEGLLRLLSLDGYRALSNLLAGEQKGIDSLRTSRGVRQPGLVLVTFYGLAPNTRFDPQLLTVTARNQLYRPIGVLPLSPGFSSQQLEARGQATAILVYDRPLPVLEPFTVSYLTSTTADWERRLPRLNAERARIVGRKATPADSIPRVP